MKKSTKMKLLSALALGTCLAWSGSASAEEAQAAEAYAMDNVVVTAERIPTEKMNTPANVSVVTSEEIEANHYQNVTEALENVPGVDITRLGAATNYVKLNGNERIVVLVDGKRINSDQGGLTGRSNINTNSLPSVKLIDRIEVVKGGGSALYGSDAVGGVINIITKKGSENATTVDISAGSNNFGKAEITNTGSFNKLSWNLQASREHLGSFRYKYHGQSHNMANSHVDADNVALRLNQKITDRQSLDFSYDHRSQESGRYKCSGATSSVNGYGGPIANEIVNDVALTYNFKEGSDAPGFLRYFNNYKSFNNAGKYNSRTQGVDYQNGWKLGDNNTLIAGAEWHRSRSSNGGNGYEGEHTTNTAIYLQDTWELTDKWTFVPGVRMDHHTSFGTHWTPKAAVNYRAGQKTQFYANWGKVFKAPTADDMYYFSDMSMWGYPSYLGNKDLKAETGWTASVGMNHQFSENASMALNLFKTDLKDAITWYSNGVDMVSTNIERERQQGMELSFKQKLGSKWSYDLAYTYTKSKMTDSYNTVTWNKRNASPNGYRLGVHYAAGKWKANLTGNVNSGLNEKSYIVGHYALWNINASYAFDKQTSAYLKLNNIFNAEYSYYPSTTTLYPGQGRSIQLGMTYSF